MAMKFTLFGKTDVGSVRDHNEDNFAVCSDLNEKAWTFSKDSPRELSKKGALLLVADGMGGTNAGEVASDIAQQSVKAAFDALDKVPEGDKEREALLKKLIVDAHNDVVKHQESNLETAGMGTTLVIAWIIDDKLHAAWSGDSRCYVLDADRPLKRFTEDHSMVWELVKTGDLTPEEARTHPNSNIINQSLGDPKNAPKPDAKTRPLYKGNRVLVCSDGLNGMISDEELEAILRNNQGISETCNELISHANAAGGHDNITCLLIDVLEGNEAVAGQTIPETVGGTTNSAKLRKKVSSAYYIIGILLVIVAGLLYMNYGTGQTEEKISKHYPTETILTDLNTEYFLDLNGFESQKELEVSEIKWKGSQSLNGTVISIKAPISSDDTLFVVYQIKGDEKLLERSFVFGEDPSLGHGADRDGAEAPVADEAPSESGTNQPAVSEPRRENRPVQPRESQPKPDTTKKTAPNLESEPEPPKPTRPRITPITLPGDSTK